MRGFGLLKEPSRSFIFMIFCRSLTYWSSIVASSGQLFTPQLASGNKVFASPGFNIGHNFLKASRMPIMHGSPPSQTNGYHRAKQKAHPPPPAGAQKMQARRQRGSRATTTRTGELVTTLQQHQATSTAPVPRKAMGPACIMGPARCLKALTPILLEDESKPDSETHTRTRTMFCDRGRSSVPKLPLRCDEIRLWQCTRSMVSGMLRGSTRTTLQTFVRSTELCAWDACWSFVFCSCCGLGWGSRYLETRLLRRRRSS